MYTGKTLFAQLMICAVDDVREGCGAVQRRLSVRTLSCGEQYRAMAFAQLTYRESLRDIETCLSSKRRNSITWVSANRLRRSTLADANEMRDWRIHGRTRPTPDRPSQEAVRRRKAWV